MCLLVVKSRDITKKAVGIFPAVPVFYNSKDISYQLDYISARTRIDYVAD